MSRFARQPGALLSEGEAACEDMARLSAMLTVRPLLMHSAG